VKIDHVLLDMDGVMCDMVSAAIRVHGRDVEETLRTWPPGLYDIVEVLNLSGKNRKQQENLFWEGLSGYDFWADLEPYPWMGELWRECRKVGRVTVVSTPTLDPMCAAGKLMWLDKHFGRRNKPFRDFVLTPDKSLLADPTRVLIDDSEDHCDAYIRALPGPSSCPYILFPQKWNRNHGFAADPMAHVRHKLGLFRNDPCGGQEECKPSSSD
jgi:hypothetical protein